MNTNEDFSKKITDLYIGSFIWSKVVFKWEVSFKQNYDLFFNSSFYFILT